jgi:ribonuclease P protein component
MAPIGRLKRRSEFLAVAAAQHKAVAPGVVLQILARETDGAPRFGFTATKTIGNSVQRNRARRRLREAARLIGPRVARTGHDYVLIARGATLTRGWTDLLGDVERVFTMPPRRAERRS